MNDAMIERLIEEVKTLTADEQLRLLNTLKKLLSNAGERAAFDGFEHIIDNLLLSQIVKESAAQSAEELLQQKLFNDGAISEIKPRVTDFTPYEDRKPVEFTGKPVSEIIIEERR